MPFSRKVRTLVADDSAMTRRALRRMLDQDPSIEIVGFARDGNDAVEKARELKPDVITLDINMPGQDGLTALQEIIYEKICPAVMVSSLTQKGAETTFEALALGAFDYVGKPDGTVSGNFEAVRDELIQKIKAAADAGTASINTPRAVDKPFETEQYQPTSSSQSDRKLATKAIAIGISTGGPTTILDVLPNLPADLPAAVFLVQHMPSQFTSTFANRLDSRCDLRVVPASHGAKVEEGVCYVAQGGSHLVPHRKADGSIIVRTPKRPETLFVPSVDVMMEGVTKIFGGPNTIGVLMTGIGNDGATSMVHLKEAGGYTIAETEESCVVYGMPRAAKEAGGVCEECSSLEVADSIIKKLFTQTN